MENETREKKLLKNTIIMALGIFAPRVINLLTTPLIVNTFSTSVYGQLNLVTTTILSLVVPVATLQLEQSFFRFVVDSKDKKEYKKIITNGYMLILLMMILVAIGVMFFPISLFNTPYLKILIIFYIWTEIIATTSRFLLRAFDKYRQYSTLAAIVVIVNFFLTAFCLLVLKMGFAGVIVALTLADVVGFVYVQMHINIFKYISLDAIDSEYRLKMLRYALPFLPNTISWYINQLSDRWMISLILDYSANGIYALANTIPSIVNILYPAFNLAWTDSAQRSANDDDRHEYYNKMFRMLFRIVSAGTVMLIAVTPVLFRILSSKKEYYLAFYFTPTLTVATYFYCISQFFGSIYVALKRTKNMAFTTGIAAIINILINLIFMAKFGVQVAVYSTLVSNLFMVVYRYFDLKNNDLPLTINRRLLVLTAIIMFTCLLLVVSNNMILWIISFVLAFIYSWLIAGDYVINIIKRIIPFKKA